MFHTLRRWLRGFERFIIPSSRQWLPKCRVRSYEPEDFEKCAEIYRLNEPNRFPPGYLEHFCKWLQSPKSLILVSEVDGEVRGLGGIDITKHREFDSLTLSFGLVDSAYHQKGFGTAMLLARLSLLEPGSWYASLCTTGGSERFYKRFGFVFNGYWVDEYGTRFETYLSTILREDVLECRRVLAKAGIAVESGEKPIPIAMEKENMQEGSRS